MQSKLIIYLENIFRRHPEPRPAFCVIMIGKRHERIESIVSARHLHDYQNVSVCPGGNLGGLVRRFRLQGGQSLGKKARDSPGQSATKRGSAEEFPASFKREVDSHKE